MEEEFWRRRKEELAPFAGRTVNDFILSIVRPGQFPFPYSLRAYTRGDNIMMHGKIEYREKKGGEDDHGLLGFGFGSNEGMYVNMLSRS